MEEEFRKLQGRLQGEVDNMLRRVSTKYVRPIQKESYLCSARCCEPNFSDAQAQQCLEGCGQPINQLQSVMEREMNSFQSRLQRCSQMCQDEANDKITPEMRSNPAKLAGIEQSMLKCSASCVDKHIAMLPSVESRIAEGAKK